MILEPASCYGEVRVFAHFFDLKRIDNPRSRESGAIANAESGLLAADWIETEPPDKPLDPELVACIQSYGDCWNDGFRSLRNLLHQLHSLEKVTQATLRWKPDIFIFLRPDLKYHDSFGEVIREAVASKRPAAFYPNWQAHGGINDRFLVCRGVEPAAAYGFRINVASAYCALSGKALNGEKLVAFALRGRGFALRPIRIRASRVRLGGRICRESFDGPVRARVDKLRRAIGRRLKLN